MANRRDVKPCEAKGQYAENRSDIRTFAMANVRMPLIVFTDSSQLLSQYPLRCCDSDCVQLFNLVFHYGLETYTSHHDHEDCASFSQRHYSWKAVERKN